MVVPGGGGASHLLILLDDIERVPIRRCDWSPGGASVAGVPADIRRLEADDEGVGIPRDDAELGKRALLLLRLGDGVNSPAR